MSVLYRDDTPHTVHAFLLDVHDALENGEYANEGCNFEPYHLAYFKVTNFIWVMYNIGPLLKTESSRGSNLSDRRNISI